MIIRVLLLTGLALIGWHIFLRRNRLPFHIVVVFALLGAGGVLVIFPGVAGDAARLVGVGRGADLINYLVQVGLLFVVLHYYTKFVEIQRQITQLVREIAILRAEVERQRAEAASSNDSPAKGANP